MVPADKEHRHSDLPELVCDRISRVGADVFFLPQIASNRDGISRMLLGEGEATSEGLKEFAPPLDCGTLGKTYEWPVKVDVGEVSDPHRSTNG
jgi:hypothetical protein